MYLLTAPMFGPKHLIGLLAVVLLNIGLYILFRKHVTTERRFVVVTMIAFYTMEAIKLGYMILRDGSFPIAHIPLHLCSIPLYVYLAWFVSKPDTFLYNAAKSTGFGVVLIAGMTALIIPVNIIGSELTWAFTTDNFLPYLSFLFHGFMIFAAWYILKAGFLRIQWKNIYEAIAFTSVLMVIALIVNAIADTDYMLLNTGKGSPLAFLRDTSQLLYTLTMIALGNVVIALTFTVGRMVTKGDKTP